jgi:predicted aspartyl protease
VGEWRDGRENGNGTLTLSKGAKYIGAWQAGKKHGQGKEYSGNGELVREGYWISDEYYGPNAPNSLRVENGDRVKMVESGGIYQVPVVINDALKLDFIVDSGATDVSIPADVVLTLIRTRTIEEGDFVGTEKYSLADGSTASSRVFIIRSLKVGERTVTNVRGSITDLNGPLLLGQSFLSKFKSWSQDNMSHELVLE